MQRQNISTRRLYQESKEVELAETFVRDDLEHSSGVFDSHENSFNLNDQSLFFDQKHQIQKILEKRKSKMAEK